MFSASISEQKRWTLLEHIGAPDDKEGRHFDFLLEDVNDCRSWRLRKMLVLDGPIQEAFPLSAHSLEWLEITQRAVSGGRGFARRVIGGWFSGKLPKNHAEIVRIQLHSNEVSGYLEINNFQVKFCSL